jgi:DNA polymerase III epsilon subunit-like protein
MKALVFDTEATGLISSRLLKHEQLPEVIEFYGAVVAFNKNGKHKIEHELELLIKPANMIQEYKQGKHNIAKITGITNAMLVGAPPFKDVASQIFGMLEEAPLAIAHNVSYDTEVLNIEAERMGYAIKWPKRLCTVEATAYMRGDRLKLSELHELLFKEKFAGAHRAKVDVQALIRCCAELHKQGII